jgi:hypothetical protein
MKRLMVFALSCLLMIIHVSAETAVVSTTTGPLKMRKEASASGEVIAEIPDGEAVLVFADEGNGWTFIDYKGVRGYVLSKRLKLAWLPTPAEIEQRIALILVKPEYISEFTGNSGYIYYQLYMAYDPAGYYISLYTDTDFHAWYNVKAEDAVSAFRLYFDNYKSLSKYKPHIKIVDGLVYDISNTNNGTADYDNFRFYRFRAAFSNHIDDEIVARMYAHDLKP